MTTELNGTVVAVEDWGHNRDPNPEETGVLYVHLIVEDPRQTLVIEYGSLPIYGIEEIIY